MTGFGAFAGSGPQHSPQKYAALVTKQKPELLELRTGSGAVYLLPSRWERIRLQWTFRHFHVICPEVLSSGDRRLVEKLWHSGVVRPSRPVPRDRVFGVIERPLSTAKNSQGIYLVEAGSGAWPEAGREPLSGADLAEPSPWQSTLQGLAALRGLAVWFNHSSGFQQWKGLALLSVVGLAVVLARVCGVPLNLRGAQPSASTAAPVATAATPAIPVPSAPIPAPSAVPSPASGTAPEQVPLARAALPAKNAHPQIPSLGDSVQGQSIQGHPGASSVVASNSVAATPGNSVPMVMAKAIPALPRVAQPPLERTGSPASGADPASRAVAQSAPLGNALVPTLVAVAAVPPLGSSTAQAPPSEARPLISELPQGRVPYPTVSDKNFVGTVTLRAVIGSDGQVKDVSVLSGDPKAARAAIAAVKQWRYAPDQVGGRKIEAETKIGISFFGQDAVSVTSPH